MVRREYCRRHLGDEKAFAEPGITEKGPRERGFKVHHLRLDTALDVEERRAVGTSTLTLSPINDGLAWVELDAVDMTIHRVRGDDGTKLAFDHAGGKDENRGLRARIAKVEARVEILGKGKRRGAPRRSSGAPGGDTTATPAAPPPEGGG